MQKHDWSERYTDGNRLDWLERYIDGHRLFMRCKIPSLGVQPTTLTATTKACIAALWHNFVFPSRF